MHLRVLKCDDCSVKLWCFLCVLVHERLDCIDWIVKNLTGECREGVRKNHFLQLSMFHTSSWPNLCFRYTADVKVLIITIIKGIVQQREYFMCSKGNKRTTLISIFLLLFTNMLIKVIIIQLNHSDHQMDHYVFYFSGSWQSITIMSLRRL